MALTGEEALALSKKHTNKAIKNISGGIHKYSTEEQIVGEWIDGKPIYEKTIIHNGFLGNESLTTDVDIKIPISIKGEIFDTLNNVYYYLPFTNTYIPIGLTLNNGNIDNITLSVPSAYGTNRLRDLIATIQYTKTTD